MLKTPDFTLTFILRTDACKSGVGCALEHEFSDGRHPILYMSKTFSSIERRYSEGMLCDYMRSENIVDIFRGSGVCCGNRPRPIAVAKQTEDE